ncbi:unnamed protein product [Ectocarpus sp. 12 AP-2014]
MEGLPQNYRDNITIDNGVEIVWVNQKGQVIPKDKAGATSSAVEDDVDVVVGMPRVASIRKSAVETELNNSSLPASPGGTRRTSVAGTVSPSPQLIGAWFTNGTDTGGEGAPSSPAGSTGPPDTEDDDADPEGHPCMALEPYAREMYNTVRKGLLGKKRTPMETLLSWKGKQITVPLTIACNQAKAVSSECVACFGDIMVYMGDKKAKESGMQLIKSLHTRLLASTQEFRDEIICQVCKQTTSNPDANSDLRGWQLILSILAVATPSKALIPCFRKHCELGPVGSIPQTYAQYALSALHKESSLAPRKAAPCDVEIMALVQLSAVPVLVRLQDGNKVEVMADSWTSVTDLEKQIASKIGLKCCTAFTVFEVTNTDGQRALRAKERILDTVAQWRTQAAATSGVKKFQLLFKVRLHLRPDDDDLAGIKLTYLQAVQDLCDGVYMVSTEDSVQLAAFQLQASRGDYDKKNCTAGSLEKELTTLVPPQILAQPEGDEFRGTKDLANKILAYYMMSLKGISKKEARALFMGLMRENPSFGRAYFDGFSQEKPVVVGIGADGVQFLDATDGDRPVLAEYGFDSIGSFVCSDEETAVMTLAAREGEQTSFVKPTAILIQSAQASQMKSLVHAYMVRYILPRRKKKEEEEKAKIVNKETDVVPFATDGA